MRTATMLMAAMLAAIPAAAPAQMAEPQCVRAGTLPPELADWNDRAPLAAAARRSGPRTVLAVGRATDLTLHPAASVAYAVKPAKTPAPDSFGGMAGVTIDRPGTYRVALGAAAWIELERGGKAIESTAHSHGPDCTGVRKLVDFVLKPGRHTLQLSGSPADRVGVKLLRLR